MVARVKVFGFIVGAVLTAAALTAFNMWRYVSDVDRLEAAIMDHCVPFTQTGATPFVGMGRPVGVFEQDYVAATMNNGGSAIIYENRFVAQWGEGEDANSSARICIVRAIPSDHDREGFDVGHADLSDWITGFISPDLVLDLVGSGSVLPFASWHQEGAADYTGLRVFLIGETGAIEQVMVMDDLDR